MNRIVRGGAWFSTPCKGRITFRSRIFPDYRGIDLGLRLARGPQ